MANPVALASDHIVIQSCRVTRTSVDSCRLDLCAFKNHVQAQNVDLVDIRFVYTKMSEVDC